MTTQFEIARQIRGALDGKPVTKWNRGMNKSTRTPLAELSRADLWAAVELFAAKQREPVASDAYLPAPDDDLKALVPSSMPRALLAAMMVRAYFERGDAYRGRWLLTRLWCGAVRIPESELQLMQTVQNLFRLPVLTLQKSGEPLSPRGRDPRAWAMKITTAIIMGNYAQLLKTDEEERQAVVNEFYEKHSDGAASRAAKETEK
jgi:hypothetical protein